MAKQLKQKIVLQKGDRYDKYEGCYSKNPNWIFDEIEYLDLDPYEILAFMYMIRLVNNKTGKGAKSECFYASYEVIAKKAKCSTRKARQIVKKLIDEGFISIVKQGNNLINRPNNYRMEFIKPDYVEGKSVSVVELLGRGEITQDDADSYLCYGVEKLYFFEHLDKPSTRQYQPQLIDNVYNEDTD